MKLYAYRALDYLQIAGENDRRYLLFCAVQKAKVSAEGVKVVGLLGECIGARGFESDTYFESALRDIQLIPSLEGSTHVNFTQAAGFLSAYLFHPDADAPFPESLNSSDGESMTTSAENPYLFRARTGGVKSVSFAHYLKAYRPLAAVANVRLFTRQAKALRMFVLASRSSRQWKEDAGSLIALGRCVATLAYGQLIAEQAAITAVPLPLVSLIFEQLVETLSAESQQLASLTRPGGLLNLLLGRVHVRARTSPAEVQTVADMITLSSPDPKPNSRHPTSSSAFDLPLD